MDNEGLSRVMFETAASVFGAYMKALNAVAAAYAADGVTSLRLYHADRPTPDVVVASWMQRDDSTNEIHYPVVLITSIISQEPGPLKVGLTVRVAWTPEDMAEVGLTDAKLKETIGWG